MQTPRTRAEPAAADRHAQDVLEHESPPGGGDDPALRELLDDLRDGTPWEAAYAAYRQRSGAGRSMPFADRRINFTWLTDLERAGRAVDLGSPFGDIAADLSLEFAEVDYVGAEGCHGHVALERLSEGGGGVRVALAPEQQARLREGSADLVVFMGGRGWKERVPAWMRAPEAVLDACARLLAPGGWAALAVPNPLCPAHWRGGAPALREVAEARTTLASFRTGVRRLGMSPFREYLLAPGLDVPTAFVPATRAAVLAYQRAAGVPARERGLTRAGLYALLFPGVLLLARR